MGKRSAAAKEQATVRPAARVSTFVESPSAATPTTAVSEDQIRLRAFQRWEASGKPDGDGTRFWFEAEQELRAAVKP